MHPQTASRSELAKIIDARRTNLTTAPEGQTISTFRSGTRLVEGLRTEASIRQFKFIIDEPTQVGGTDCGPNPVEIVLAALGACQEIVYAVHAARLGIAIEQLEIEVEGELDARGFYAVSPVAPGFSAVRYRVRIKSPEMPERVRALVETVQHTCPVLDILQRPLPIQGDVELNGVPLH